MKRVVLITLVLSVSLIFLSSFSAMGQEKKVYVAVKAGVYEPTGDLDDAEFDSDFNGEVAIGFYPIPNLALEAGIGYFVSEASYSFFAFDPVYGSINLNEDDEVKVIPVTITAKGVLPADMFELYLGAGIGWYFASYDAKASASGVVLGTPIAGSASFDDDDSVLGAHVVGGAIINISEAFFVGVEGKVIWTDEAKAEGNVRVNVDGYSALVPIVMESDLNGYTVTGVVGVRF
jgi:hypothetical protein